MKVYLLDGTYELFRHFFGVPPHRNAAGQEVAAVRGVVGSVLAMLEDGVTHLGVATDHVIESFRNDLWPGYKTSAGVAEELLAQFDLLEDALRALGVTVWAMTTWEADDALAASAALAAADPAVEQVVICTPDKDLGQCVVGRRVVQLDRRHRREIDEDGVRERFGVHPRSIPDYLALVGDSADGFPGLSGWGPKSAATVLARYETIEAIPDAAGRWEVTIRSAPALAATLAANRELAALFKDLATLRRDPGVLTEAGPSGPTVEGWRWNEPTERLELFAQQLDAPDLVWRARHLAERRAKSTES